MPARQIVSRRRSMARAFWVSMDRVGSLEPGKQADIIAIDLSKSHQIPTHYPYGTIVHTANQENVLMTIGRRAGPLREPHLERAGPRAHLRPRRGASSETPSRVAVSSASASLCSSCFVYVVRVLASDILREVQASQAGAQGLPSELIEFRRHHVSDRTSSSTRTDKPAEKKPATKSAPPRSPRPSPLLLLLRPLRLESRPPSQFSSAWSHCSEASSSASCCP